MHEYQRKIHFAVLTDPVYQIISSGLIASFMITNAGLKIDLSIPADHLSDNIDVKVNKKITEILKLVAPFVATPYLSHKYSHDTAFIDRKAIKQSEQLFINFAIRIASTLDHIYMDHIRAIHTHYQNALLMSATHESKSEYMDKYYADLENQLKSYNCHRFAYEVNLLFFQHIPAMKLIQDCYHYAISTSQTYQFKGVLKTIYDYCKVYYPEDAAYIGQIIYALENYIADHGISNKGNVIKSNEFRYFVIKTNKVTDETSKKPYSENYKKIIEKSENLTEVIIPYYLNLVFENSRVCSNKLSDNFEIASKKIANYVTIQSILGSTFEKHWGNRITPNFTFNDIKNIFTPGLKWRWTDGEFYTISPFSMGELAVSIVLLDDADGIGFGFNNTGLLLNPATKELEFCRIDTGYPANELTKSFGRTNPFTEGLALIFCQSGETFLNENILKFSPNYRFGVQLCVSGITFERTIFHNPERFERDTEYKGRRHINFMQIIENIPPYYIHCALAKWVGVGKYLHKSAHNSLLGKIDDLLQDLPPNKRNKAAQDKFKVAISNIETIFKDIYRYYHGYYNSIPNYPASKFNIKKLVVNTSSYRVIEELESLNNPKNHLVYNNKENKNTIPITFINYNK